MAYEAALPDDDSGSLQDYLDALRRRRGTALKIAAGILAAGLLIIFLLPNSYRSEATILIEDPEVPPTLVQTTVSTMAARQIEFISQRVMTRTNVAQIIEKFDLYKSERKYLPTLLLVDEVQNDIMVEPIDVPNADPSGRAGMSSVIAFKLGFEHDDPATARQVANELVSLYLAENVRSRTEQTAETTSFVQAEVDRLDGEVRDIEGQIAEIKRANEGALPQLTATNITLLQSYDREIENIDRQIAEAESQKILYETILPQIEPMEQMITPEGRPIAAPADQLRAAQSELTRLSARYGPDHPDVMRARRDVEGLRAEVGQDLAPRDTASRLTDAQAKLSQAREKYSDEHPEVVTLKGEVAALQAELDSQAAAPAPQRKAVAEPNNPDYLQALASRKQLDTRIASLQTQRSQVRAKIGEYERNIGQSSEVERQLSALGRKLETSTAMYEAARSRLFMAQMGQSMESQSKGERFSLVEPPDLPLVPSSPNRPFLMILVLLLALAAGFGFPQVAESMDGSINSARAIERVQGSPPLAEIPLITNSSDKMQQRKLKLGVLVGIPIAIAIIAALVHFFVINLDVLWYVLVRRMGM